MVVIGKGMVIVLPSPIYHPNQGNIFLIQIWGTCQYPDPPPLNLKVVYIFNCGLFVFGADPPHTLFWTFSSFLDIFMAP